MTEWLPLLGFAIATSVTPGPNVLMVAAGAASHGVRGVVPHMLGITGGFGAMLLLVGLGLAGPLAASVWLHEAMRWAGAAWLLWLAWKIASAPVSDRKGAGEGPRRPPMGFRSAALFQWVNPKAWMIAAAVTPAFTRAGEPLLPQVVAISAAFIAVSLPCLLVWAGIGAGAGRLLRSPGRLRAFNILMALLLVASLVPMLR
ncbi:LysE family translocator [Falsiroseomonas stagni]|uniref:Threonine/homoserine/homoserine lactone efflux protein n=1 Tax=Falsiroseomonas stagni DSM 19981 TaxID=1123062 RepID=A0A1I3Z4Y5_9PROT|nr:LysE family translocator [Falsiroseomonas stagni]SFK39168.1 Threonine/homoserine/homoserine lactone efflux protein [Falsiroseomonas stagni DSM 19981]